MNRYNRRVDRPDEPPTPDGVPTSSADLDRLLRWETAGGTWVLAGERADSVTIALCRCDGGEEVERMTSADPAVRAYVDAADRSRSGTDG